MRPRDGGVWNRGLARDGTYSLHFLPPSNKATGGIEKSYSHHQSSKAFPEAWLTSKTAWEAHSSMSWDEHTGAVYPQRHWQLYLKRNTSLWMRKEQQKIGRCFAFSGTSLQSFQCLYHQPSLFIPTKYFILYATHCSKHQKQKETRSQPSLGINVQTFIK